MQAKWAAFTKAESESPSDWKTPSAQIYTTQSELHLSGAYQPSDCRLRWFTMTTGERVLSTMCMIIGNGVPARLGKGQGAKEIGHNLARERPKFGHNSVRKRRTKSGAVLSANDQVTLLRVNDQNSVTIQQSKLGLGKSMKTWAQICKHFYIGCLKTQIQQLQFVNKKQN